MSSKTSISDRRENKVNIDSILGELGPFGVYQCYVLLLLCIPHMLGAMYSMNFIFTADDVPYRCKITECEGDGLSYEEPWTMEYVPTDTRCNRYAPINSTANDVCHIDNYNLNETIPCDSWVYGSNDTIVAEFDLGCQDFKRTLVGSIRSVAVVFALVLTGFVSDRWGRKTAFCLFSFFICVIGIIKSFSINYEMYISLEFFEGLLGYGFLSGAYIILVELARPYLRVIFVSFTGIAWGLGGALFGVIAMYVPYWRDLLRAIHIPAIMFFLYIFILDESPRWLYGKGRKQEAKRIIMKAARWNKLILSEEALKKLDSGPEKLIKESKAPQKNILIQVATSKVLVTRFAVMCFCWIASSFVYYGLTINSVSLSGNKYINFSLSSLMEVVASILIMMSLERFGRKKCIMSAFIVCGICCIMPQFISNNSFVMTLFFIGKIAITYAFNSVYVYTSELYPTSVRSSLHSGCSLVGRIGAVLAPQTPLLARVFPLLPSLLFGAMALIAGLLLIMMPETKNTRLPESVDEAEKLEDLRIENDVFVTNL